MQPKTNEFRPEHERVVVLSPIEIEKILSINPEFESISKYLYFDNYDLPCPIKIEIKKKDGGTEAVVLRKDQHEDVQREVKIFKALDDFGLPVPKILAEPFENEEGEWCAVYSLLPGQNLQKLSSESEEGLQEAKELVIKAVQQLTSAGAYISQQDEFKDLPRITLVDELEAVKQSGSEWLGQPLYREAVRFLESKLREVNTTLVFSNGDYQPGNFLAQNGKITGFLDFEYVSFQDPLMGFVKYPIYDLFPLGRTNLIDRVLETMGFTREEFSLRLILGCLKTIKEEIKLSGGDEEMQEYRKRVLAVLNEELESFS